MAHINRSALVPFSTEQMFALVDGIRDYPRFLPWCRSSTEISREPDEVKASIEIARGGLNKHFTTLNRMQPNRLIEMSLVDGPFRHLHGFWRFDELKAGACKVSLELDYEFSSRLVGLAVGPVFNQVANTLVDSFVQRARELYGKG
ncbi:MAG TPA: type II toxin-antitoxin system RatA family toxin [Thiolinea sp.]|nr:type II toxin-antitoxin system RatA family toxin [Thiolinea sp.]